MGRTMIVRFVQQRCPAGSACAFSGQELRELNAKRDPKDPFLPYPP